jgi:hypothetical protein
MSASERDAWNRAVGEIALDAEHAQEFMLAHNLHDVGMKTMARRLRALALTLPAAAGSCEGLPMIDRSLITELARGNGAMTDERGRPMTYWGGKGQAMTGGNMDKDDLVKRLRLGASISRDRGINLDFAKIADEAADALSRMEATVVVPREPTQQMQAAGMAAGFSEEGDLKTREILKIVRNIYRAMLASTPAQPSAEVAEVVAELRQKAEYPTVGPIHTRIIPVRLLLAAASLLERMAGGK